MADDPNLEPGKSISIATVGVGGATPISVATDGFIAPIIGDLIFDGQAGIEFLSTQGAEYIYFSDGGLITNGSVDFRRRLVYTGSDGLVVDGDGLVSRGHITTGAGGAITTGTASIERTFTYLGNGAVTLSGNGNIEQTVQPVANGFIILGGGASIRRSYTYQAVGEQALNGASTSKLVFNSITSGGLITGGSGFVNFTLGVTGNGGITVLGKANIDASVPVGFGRGGAHIPRNPRKIKTDFEWPVFNPDDYLEPMDYLKKIQDALTKAEQDKLNLLKYLSQGKMQINGQGQVTVVFRDQPDGDIFVSNNPPLEPIVLDLPSVFKQGQTAIEIAELEDHLLLNDIFGLGDYKIQKGPKARYIQHGRKSAGGEATVKFVSGISSVVHVNRKERQRRLEDDELLLGINRRRKMSRQEKDDEELRLLGVID